MSKSSLYSLQLNDVLKFNDDAALPCDIRSQPFKVKAIHTLLLNDVYFNHQLFPSYELIGEKGTQLKLSPFQFEEDNDELKLRVTKEISVEELKALFEPHDIEAVLTNKRDENIYLAVNEKNIPLQLQNWVGRTYYPDLKDQEISTSTYIQYDTGGKKNLNHVMLLKKYPNSPYFMYLGDYNTFYLEVNLNNTLSAQVTSFLQHSDLEVIR